MIDRTRRSDRKLETHYQIALELARRLEALVNGTAIVEKTGLGVGDEYYDGFRVRVVALLVGTSRRGEVRVIVAGPVVKLMVVGRWTAALLELSDPLLMVKVDRVVGGYFQEGNLPGL